MEVSVIVSLLKKFSPDKNKVKPENNDLGNCHFPSVEILVKLYHFT